MSPEDIREFQEDAFEMGLGRSFDGEPLECDGIMGPKTAWLMHLSTLPGWRQDVCQEAVRHIGHKEESANDSQLIRWWLECAGVDRPAPWCAAFASHCLDSMCDFDRQASVLRLAKQLHPVFAEDALPGDLVWWHTGRKGSGTGHCGVLLAQTREPWDQEQFLVCEGNTSNMVATRVRSGEHINIASLCPYSGMGRDLRLSTKKGRTHVEYDPPSVPVVSTKRATSRGTR